MRIMSTSKIHPFLLQKIPLCSTSIIPLFAILKISLFSTVKSLCLRQKLILSKIYAIFWSTFHNIQISRIYYYSLLIDFYWLIKKPNLWLSAVVRGPYHRGRRKLLKKLCRYFLTNIYGHWSLSNPKMSADTPLDHFSSRQPDLDIPNFDLAKPKRDWHPKHGWPKELSAQCTHCMTAFFKIPSTRIGMRLDAHQFWWL